MGEHQGKSSLFGLDSNVWVDGVDLIAPNPRVQDDPFSRWLCGSFIHFFHGTVGQKRKAATDIEGGWVEYDDTRLLRIADIIGAILSPLMPVSSVIILYFVPDLLTRLGIISFFTILFSVTLLLMTKARKVEIFTATAAYDALLWWNKAFADSLRSFASIQVVFVGSTTPTGK